MSDIWQAMCQNACMYKWDVRRWRGGEERKRERKREREERKREMEERREKERRKKKKNEEERKGRKGKERGKGRSVEQRADLDNKRPGTKLREVGFLLLQLFYA